MWRQSWVFLNLHCSGKRLRIPKKYHLNEEDSGFPGSFDPFTVGHEAIIRRAMSLFDEIIIAVGANALKKNYYSLATRKEMITKVFRNEQKVRVDHYEGLTVDYCKKNGARYLLRGLRTSSDFEFERAIGQVNKTMAPGIESVFLLTAPE